MNILLTHPKKTAELHKENKLYAVRLFEHNKYIETFYCRRKSDIKPHLIKIGYNITYDFTLLKNK